MLYKRSQLPENLDENSKMVDRDEGWCWNWFAATVSSSGDICDFYETFENNPLRFIAQIQSSFSSPFFPRRFPGPRFQMPADSDCVYRVCNGQSGAAFVCFKYSLIKLDFGILNPPSQRPLLPRIVLESSFIAFCVVSDTINNACHRDNRAGLIFFFLNALSA